ncbi:MAG: ComEA family DNA-binding protein [Pseudomonadota bacterium]
MTPIQKAGTGLQSRPRAWAVRTFRQLLPIACLAISLGAFAGEPVNVNTANAEQLAASLDGVGMSKAEAIVAYRKANGPYRHPDELVNVKGIGLSTVDRNRDYIRLTDKPPSKSGS